MLKVFYTQITDLPVDLEGLSLSEYRLKKLERISLEDKRKQSIGAELLLNHAVNSVFSEIKAPFEIEINDLGKPVFNSIPLHFSLSHSGNYAACAVSDKLVGIDIETKVGYNAALIKRFFAPAEQSFFENVKDEDYEFGRFWTAKESALKYIGTGLSRALSSVLLIKDDCILVEPEKTGLRIIHKYIDNMHISVCTSSDEVCDDFTLVKLK